MSMISPDGIGISPDQERDLRRLVGSGTTAQ